MVKASNIPVGVKPGAVRWVPREQWEREAELECKVMDLEKELEASRKLLEGYYEVGDETIFTIKLGRYKFRLERNIY